MSDSSHHRQCETHTNISQIRFTETPRSSSLLWTEKTSLRRTTELPSLSLELEAILTGGTFFSSCWLLCCCSCWFCAFSFVGDSVLASKCHKLERMCETRALMSSETTPAWCVQEVGEWVIPGLPEQGVPSGGTVVGRPSARVSVRPSNNRGVAGSQRVGGSTFLNYWELSFKLNNF